MHRVAAALLVALSIACTCGSPEPAPITPTPITPTPITPTTPSTETSEARPRIVVVAIFDQLGSDTLQAQIDHLDPSGAIRRTRARGRYVHRARYGYSATFTAPGHAAIHSGAAPRDSHIGSNRVHDPVRGRISVLDDGVHTTWGRDDAFASPERLRAETVADVIQAERPDSIVVALGMKDRSAILPGGQHPDLCLWYDARAGGFTSSRFYGEGPPAWLEAFRARERLTVEGAWMPRDPAALEAWLGPDARPGEGGYGLGASFPHVMSEDPEAVLATPESTEHLLALAATTVRELRMGDDEVPDLLALSIASTDYIGHAFGPDSWEYAEVLARVDAALGTFLAELEREHGPIAVLITSDHGVAPLVEHTRAEGHPEVVRLSSESLRAGLEAHLTRTLGPPPGAAWVSGWVQPYAYLAVNDEARARAMPEALAYLRAVPGVGAALDARAVGAAAVPEGDGLETLVAQAIPAIPTGDIYVMPAEGSASVEEMDEGVGTSHGSAWLYDRDVPVLFSGPGVAHDEIDEVAPQCRVAGTIAQLSRVRAPEHACGAL